MFERARAFWRDMQVRSPGVAEVGQTLDELDRHIAALDRELAAFDK